MLEHSACYHRVGVLKLNVSPLDRSESSLAAMLRVLSSPSSVRNSEITHSMDDVILTDEQ